MVISAAEYERLAARPESSLLEFLSNTGFSDLDFELPRREAQHRPELDL
jgi:hypothetical protein